MNTLTAAIDFKNAHPSIEIMESGKSALVWFGEEKPRQYTQYKTFVGYGEKLLATGIIKAMYAIFEGRKVAGEGFVLNRKAQVEEGAKVENLGYVRGSKVSSVFGVERDLNQSALYQVGWLGASYTFSKVEARAWVEGEHQWVTTQRRIVNSYNALQVLRYAASKGVAVMVSWDDSKDSWNRPNSLLGLSQAVCKVFAMFVLGEHEAIKSNYHSAIATGEYKSQKAKTYRAQFLGTDMISTNSVPMLNGGTYDITELIQNEVEVYKKGRMVATQYITKNNMDAFVDYINGGGYEVFLIED